MNRQKNTRLLQYEFFRLSHIDLPKEEGFIEKRGRPKKNINEVVISLEKRTRGRPRKVIAVA